MINIIKYLILHSIIDRLEAVLKAYVVSIKRFWNILYNL